MAKLEATIPSTIPGFRFRLEAQGFSIGQASKIDGLSLSTDIITYRGGADGSTFRKQKGITKYDDLVVEKLHTDNKDTWNLLGLVFEPTIGLLGVTSPIYKTDLIITLLDMDGSERVKYFIKQAWITGYEIGNLDANTSNMAIEKITFAHEGITQLGIDF